jgi:hypothetical protein
VFNHIIRGYICPYCRQLDATREIAKQQARQAAKQQHYHQPVYYEQPRAPSNNQGESLIESVVGATVGCLVTLALVVFLISVTLGVIVGIWNAIIYPVIHFISFGLF